DAGAALRGRQRRGELAAAKIGERRRLERTTVDRREELHRAGDDRAATDDLGVDDDLGGLAGDDRTGQTVRVAEAERDGRLVHPDLDAGAATHDQVEPAVTVDVNRGDVIGRGEHRVRNDLSD